MKPITTPAKNKRGRPPSKAGKAKQEGQKIENCDLEKGEENKSGSNNVSQNKPIIVSFP